MSTMTPTDALEMAVIALDQSELATELNVANHQRDELLEEDARRRARLHDALGVVLANRATNWNYTNGLITAARDLDDDELRIELAVAYAARNELAADGEGHRAQVHACLGVILAGVRAEREQLFRQNIHDVQTWWGDAPE